MNRFIQHLLIVSLITIGALRASEGAAYAQTTAIIHVDITNGDLDPPNWGQNGWEDDAYRFLQDALEAAGDLLVEPHNFDEVEVWVAQGTYAANESKDYDVEGCDLYVCCEPYCNHAVPFELLNNVEILGGFSGDGSEVSRTERRPLENITTLTGLWNVVTSHDNDSSARLDGLHIANGAKGTTAIHVRNSSILFMNCTMRGNIDIHNAQVQFLVCVFDARQGASLRCGGKSDVIIWRGRIDSAIDAVLPTECVIVEGRAKVFLAESRERVRALHSK